MARRRALGDVLAPVVLVATVFLALGIVSLMMVLAARGLDATVGVAVAIAVLAAAEALVVVRWLRALDPATRLDDVLRGTPDRP